MNTTISQSNRQTYIQPSFAAGINTALPSEILPDNAAQDILNMEYRDDDYLATRAGVLRWESSTVFSDRITSLHYYENEEGDISILATSGTKLYRADNINPVFSVVNAGPSALTLPNDSFWMWRNWNGVALGATHNTTPSKLLVFDGTDGLFVTASPNARYLEIWNERVWIVDGDEPNVVKASTLGDYTDWTETTSASSAITLDVGKDDGDRITGIYSFRGRLFIFKRTKIYVIAALEGTIPTDAGNLYVDVYANNIGCISPYSIQSVLDDVLFLSDSGVASLVNAPLGELKTALVSQNVREIRDILKSTSEISSLVIEHANQYWLLVPSDVSPRMKDEIYVLDIRRIQESLIRWVRFDGKIAGTVACNAYVNGDRFVIIGGTDGKTYLYIPGLTNRSALWDVGRWDLSFWDDDTNTRIFMDEDVSFIKKLITKSYQVSGAFLRNRFHRFGLNLSTISTVLHLNVLYYLDKLQLLLEQFDFTVSKTPNFAFWDIGKWEQTRWDGRTTTTQDFAVIRQFRRGGPRKGVNATFEITAEQSEGFVLKDIMIEYNPLSQHRVNDVNKIT